MKPRAFIVEGRHDVERLKRLDPNIMVFEVNGSAIDGVDKAFLKRLEETHEIVIFTDPDHAGERIRRILSNQLNEALHAHIDAKDAISVNGQKIGIEHASDNVIDKAIGSIRTVFLGQPSDVTVSDLYDLGLMGKAHSRKKRQRLADAMSLGHVNGKTLMSRLHLFGITKQTIEEVLSESSNEEEVRAELLDG
jgi:ribonuclease M5